MRQTRWDICRLPSGGPTTQQIYRLISLMNEGLRVGGMRGRRRRKEEEDGDGQEHRE